MKGYRNLIQLTSILGLLFMWSCSGLKYVPDDEYLLKSIEIKQKNKKVFSNNDLNTYLRQKPNKRILGVRFHLFLYNLSKPSKDNRLNNYFRKIGEAPVIYDELLTNRTKEQLLGYYEAKGYHHASISDTTIFKKRGAYVSFDISAKKPYKINKVAFSFEDESIRELVLSDTANSLLQPGDILDKEVLDNERGRIESLLKQHGYFSFLKDDIGYLIDDTLTNSVVNVEIIFRKYYDYRISRYSQNGEHKQYIINNVYIFKNYDPKEALEQGESYFSNIDTTKYDDLNFLTKGESQIKSGILSQSVYILPGDLYNLDNVELTRKHLSALQTFKMININFVEVEDENTWDNIKNIDCIIQLNQAIFQSHQTTVEGTNTSGNIGGGGSFVYRHGNLLHGAENLNVTLRGSAETLFFTADSSEFNAQEVGIEGRLTLPKFLLPIKTENFIKKYNPKTSFSLSYNYRNQPILYKRTSLNFSFGYIWKSNKYTTHIINPFRVNLLTLSDTTAQFNREISSNPGYYLSSYDPRLITVSDYSLIFTNQDIKKKSDFIFLRWNVEVAGNTLYALMKAFSSDTVGNYRINETLFSQYIKSDIDLRYYNVISPTKTLVFRFFAGIAYPYRNSNTIPHEKKYFAGGANSIRAWKPAYIGPGSSNNVDKKLAYVTGRGDMKLESNVEYRFQFTRLLEGALFVDAGNVWAVNNQETRPGAIFDHKTFYKEIAVGSGFGIRFLFDMFIVRVDYGLKIYDPVNLYNDSGIPVKELGGEINRKWIFDKGRIKPFEDGAIHLGIAYPF